MWSLLKSVLVKVAVLRWLFGSLGSLAALLPAALLLLKFGWPLLLVLGVLALPLMIFLAVIGLPLLAVFVVGGLLLGLVAMLIPFALMALKLFLFVVLPIWLVFKVAGWVFGWGRGTPPAPPTAPGEVRPADA